MKTLVIKLGELATVIEREKEQAFLLFALALPEDAIAWDLMISANWINSDQDQALRYLVRSVQRVLTKVELRELSGILLFDPNNFEPVISTMKSRSGRKETNIDFFGRRVQEVYVFAAPVEEFQISSRYSE